MLKAKRQVRFIEACYKLYEHKMYHVAYSILGDERQAEDAVQDAFLKLMQHEVNIEDPESDDCKRYIITVIKNAAINQYNKNKRTNEVLFFTDQDDETIAAEEQVLYTETSEIENMMNYLPEKYRDVIYYRVIEELSVRETAKKLKISETNVRKRYERAREMMKNMYEGRHKNGNQKLRVI